MPDRQPQRTCVGCRARRSQAELIRLHLDEGGRIQADRNGFGRGAWLCADQSERCFAGAMERKAFARAFRKNPDRSSLEAMFRRWSA